MEQLSSGRGHVTYVNQPPYEKTETLRPVLPKLVNCILPGLKAAADESDDIVRVIACLLGVKAVCEASRTGTKGALVED